jgi:hypothetical protein
MAIPAGFEPATRGVEICLASWEINGLAASWCNRGVSLANPYGASCDGLVLALCWLCVGYFSWSSLITLACVGVSASEQYRSHAASN